MPSYTIKNGDTFSALAETYKTTVAAIQTVNPGVDPNRLQVGQVVNLPDGPATNDYIIKSGDTFASIAASLKVDVSAILSLNAGVNPNKLQIGQVIKIPGTAAGSPIPAPVPTPIPAPTPSIPNTYTIQGGDTFTTIASKLGTSAATIQSLNPGVDPTSLQIGQVIKIPSSPAHGPETPIPIPGTPNNPSTIGGSFMNYSGPASNFPNPASWATYQALWAFNANLMKNNSSPQEISFINNAIGAVSQSSGVDPRVVLCIIMQESGGNAHAGITFSWEGVRNTGLMQAHNGAIFDPGNPSGSIERMIRDGAEGTASGDGLKQCFARFGNWYEACRAYNSGSVDRGNLNNGLGATGDYVQKVANRLMGNVWVNM